MTNLAIHQLLTYGLRQGLVADEDIDYTYNRLLEALGLPGDGPFVPQEELPLLPAILRTLTDDAVARGCIADSVGNRDLLDTKLMGVLTPPPSRVIDEIKTAYQAQGPRAATDRFYALEEKVNYIRTDRIALDLRWKTMTPYGEMDITVNLSKPEKDPRDIAAAKLRPQSGYPACLLCAQNEGYAGRADHPARQNLRLYPLVLDGEAWAMQYSPYAYFTEHCIVLSRRHTPMVIDAGTFRKLMDFVRTFPHYTIGSNADLPIVGGSILSHEHYQGGRYVFPMQRARVERSFAVPGYSDVICGVVCWPMSVLRLRGADAARVAALAGHVLESWRGYTDEDAVIFAETDGKPHNTITPIACQADGLYQLDLVLRNNLATPEHPLGLYHPHAALHHIKKENIGLIEVMGLAVLPARLKGEMRRLNEALRQGEDLHADASIAAHADWAEGLARQYAEKGVTLSALEEAALAAVLREEIGHVFCRVLTDAGVFSRDEAGQRALDRFLATL